MVKKFELQQLRAKALKEGRVYCERAEAEQRDMSAEENESFQKAIEDIKKLDKRISDIEQLEKLDEEAADSSAQLNSKKPDGRAETRDAGRPVNSLEELASTREYKRAWIKAVIGGDHKAADAELRTVNTTVGTGGYAITPTQLIDDVQKLMANYCWIEKFAKKYVATSPNVRIPLLSTRMAVAAYGSTETTTTTADTTQAFTNRDMVPYLLSSLVKVSRLSADFYNFEDLVAQEMALAFSYARESKYLTGAGSGSTEPLGVFTASASGVSTGRDVSSGSSTSITADACLSAKYKIKQQYINSPSMRWIFHRDAMAIISKLKANSAGTYLFANGINGQADTLCGIPVCLSEYAPNTFTTGLYVGILGDLSQYAVVDVNPSLDIQRITELYAATHEIGLLGRMFNNGNPVIEEAFARLKTD